MQEAVKFVPRQRRYAGGRISEMLGRRAAGTLIEEVKVIAKADPNSLEELIKKNKLLLIRQCALAKLIFRNPKWDHPYCYF